MTRSAWRRSLAYPAVLSLGLAALASCAEAPPPPPPQRVAVAPAMPPPPPRPRRAVRRPTHKPAPPAAPEAAVPEGGDDTAMLGAEAAAPAAAPPPPVPRSGELIGLDQAAAKRLFGAASEQSAEPPATVWRYRSASCGLDLYFYLDLRSGRMRTLRYAFNGDAADSAARQSCLKSLVVTRRT